MKSLVLSFYFLFCSCIFAQMRTDSLVKGDSLSKHELSIWDVFQQRRSVRKYRPDPIPMQDILKIIDAARMAPTAGNQQPWKFVIVTDKSLIDEMRDSCISEALEGLKRGNKEVDAAKKEEITGVFNNYLSAPVYIVVLTDNNSMYPSYNHWDGPIAAGYLLLAARALGYGTVFITDAIPEKVTKEVLHIPDNYTRVCITPVGVPVEWPSTPAKKQLKEFIAKERF